VKKERETIEYLTASETFCSIFLKKGKSQVDLQLQYWTPFQPFQQRNKLTVNHFETIPPAHAD